MEDKTKTCEDCDDDCGNPKVEEQINALLVERSKKTIKDLGQYIR